MNCSPTGNAISTSREAFYANLPTLEKRKDAKKNYNADFEKFQEGEYAFNAGMSKVYSYEERRFVVNNEKPLFNHSCYPLEEWKSDRLLHTISKYIEQLFPDVSVQNQVKPYIDSKIFKNVTNDPESTKPIYQRIDYNKCQERFDKLVSKITENRFLKPQLKAEMTLEIKELRIKIAELKLEIVKSQHEQAAAFERIEDLGPSWIDEVIKKAEENKKDRPDISEVGKKDRNKLIEELYKLKRKGITHESNFEPLLSIKNLGYLENERQVLDIQEVLRKFRDSKIELNAKQLELESTDSGLPAQFKETLPAVLKLETPLNIKKELKSPGIFSRIWRSVVTGFTSIGNFFRRIFT